MLWDPCFPCHHTLPVPLPPCQAVSCRPDWPEAHITLARVQLNFGEPLMALHSYQAAARLQPEHPDLVRVVLLTATAFPDLLLVVDRIISCVVCCFLCI
jgi:hypothetical protein